MTLSRLSDVVMTLSWILSFWIFWYFFWYVLDVLVGSILVSVGSVIGFGAHCSPPQYPLKACLPRRQSRSVRPAKSADSVWNPFCQSLQACSIILYHFHLLILLHQKSHIYQRLQHIRHVKLFDTGITGNHLRLERSGKTTAVSSVSSYPLIMLHQ